VARGRPARQPTGVPPGGSAAQTPRHETCRGWRAGRPRAIRLLSSAALDYTLGKRRLAADCELPWLAPAEARADADLTLRLLTRSKPEGPFAPWYEADAVSIARAEDQLLARFPDGTAFLVTSHCIALVDAPGHYTIDDLAAYALGPVLAVALHLQGAVLLHAAAVAIGGKAILFAGDSGSGKSTIAAILHRLGYRVLSDDVTEVADGEALASLAAIRLWPDVVEALYGPAGAFPDRAPSWEKKMVAVAPADSCPIGAILFLEERADSPRIERLAPRDGWQRLMADTYTSRLPDPRMARRIFEQTSALADRIPMFAFSPPPLAASQELGAFLERALG
jgi:hypothetical protein